MTYKRFDLPMKRVRLYPVGDFHYGSEQSDVAFVKQIIKIIFDDPEARWVGLGDFMENAVIGSKSDVYLTTMPPNKQIEHLVEMLTPIKNKCLVMLPGNHEQRTFRLAGIHPSSIIAKELGVPYIEYSALLTLDLLKAHTPRSFLVYFHHGHGGGFTQGGKVNAAAKLRAIVPTADAIFSGHSHTTSRTPVTWYDASWKGLQRKTGYDYIIGSTLSWRGSYAEEKGARPSTIEHIVVTFTGSTQGSKDNRKQTYEVIQPE